MIGKQPEALRLADCLERDFNMNWPDFDNGMSAAAELRRLHARNAELESEVLAERERCARIVDASTKRRREIHSLSNGLPMEPCEIAAAIRAGA